MKRYRPLLQIAFSFFIAVGIIIFLLFQKRAYLRYGIELCAADYLFICSDAQISGLLIGTLSIFLVAPFIDRIDINTLLRYESREKYYLHQIIRLVIGTTIITVAFEMVVIVFGLLTSAIYINWAEYDSYFYHETWSLSHIALIQVCLVFWLSSFTGILSINLIFCTIRWVSNTVLPGLAAAFCLIALDSANVSIIFDRLEFTKIFALQNHLALQFTVPFLIIIASIILGLILCKSKDILNEK